MSKLDEKKQSEKETNIRGATLSLMLLGFSIVCKFHPVVAILSCVSAWFFILDRDNTDDFDKIFYNCKLLNKEEELPTLVKQEITAIGVNYYFTIPVGLTIGSFEDKIFEVEQALKANVIFKRTPDYTLLLQVIYKDFEKVYLADLRKPPFTNTKPMQFVIGKIQTDKGELEADIDYDKCEGHILINGGTGAGKSTFLRLFLAQVVYKNLVLHGIDMKGTELSTFRGYSKLVLSRDVDSALTHLVALYDLMNARNQIFYEANCKDIKEYASLHLHDMAPVLVAIDEFAPFRNDKNVKAMLSKLLSMSRSAGIYFLLSTQRIDSKTMGDLKVNLGIRVNLKAETESDSEIAMGKGDKRAYYLKDKGRLYLKYDGKQNVLVQSYFLDNDKCKEQLANSLNGKCWDTYSNPEYILNPYTALPITISKDNIPTKLDKVHMTKQNLNSIIDFQADEEEDELDDARWIK